MLHGIAVPELHQSGGAWKWHNYQDRYHDMHVDLMDVLSGYGASRYVGLGKSESPRGPKRSAFNR